MKFAFSFRLNEKVSSANNKVSKILLNYDVRSENDEFT